MQEYESSKKKSEIDKLQESLGNADVVSEVEGVVKEVNTTPKMDSSGQNAAFISILSAGEYRIKGTVSELNVSAISEGQAVLVHSRIDPAQVWNGVVESIDREASTDQNNNMYYYGGDTGEKSSKYNFYVLLDDLEGLMLGQHVYIEPDLGDNVKKEGMWLPAMYIAHDDSGSFVWAKDEKDKLEKRVVLLGEYDSGNDMYEIKSGVTKADSIAYPSNDLKPGIPTTTDASAAMPLEPDMADGNEYPGGDMAGGDVPGNMDGFAPEGGGDSYSTGDGDTMFDNGSDMIGGADGGGDIITASSVEGGIVP